MEAIDKGADLELKVAATDATNATPSMKELLLTLLEGFHVLETMLYGKIGKRGGAGSDCFIPGTVNGDRVTFDVL